MMRSTRTSPSSTRDGFWFRWQRQVKGSLFLCVFCVVQLTMLQSIRLQKPQLEGLIAHPIKTFSDENSTTSTLVGGDDNTTILNDEVPVPLLLLDAGNKSNTSTIHQETQADRVNGVNTTGNVLSLLREENLNVVRKAPLVDIAAYVSMQAINIKDEHPHMGAQDEELQWGYVHDVTRLKNNPPPFNTTALDLETECRSKADDDADYAAMQRLRIATETNASHARVKILCSVYSSTSSHHKIPLLQETWGQKCDGFFVGSDHTNVNLDTVNIAHEGPEAYENMWQKVRSMWSYIYDNYYNEFDWFHMGGDDMYIIVENLRYYLESDEIRAACNGGFLDTPMENTMQTPLYLGLPVAHGANWEDIINIGGPGYTLNKAALKILVTEGLPNIFPHMAKSNEDLLIGRLFRKLNVLPYMTMDDDRGNRYNHFNPGRHYLGAEAPFFKKYTKHLNYTRGQNHSSVYSISFHYINRYEPHQMRRLHALTYGPCNNSIADRSREEQNRGVPSSNIPTKQQVAQPDRGSEEINFEPGSNATLPTVACVIYTYHGARELIAESYETWGKHCDFFAAYSDEDYEYSAADKKSTVFLRTPPAPKRDLWNDVKSMWLDLAGRYDNNTLDTDFVVFSGDDAFWIMPNLKRYLSTFHLPSNNKNAQGRFFLGGVDGRRRNTDPWVGGAGYAISRQLIAERVLDKCPSKRAQQEDVLTSRCLYSHGVNFTDTRDGTGRSRFCRSTPDQPCGDRFDIKEPSDEVVLFHYTKGATRKDLYHKYYSL